MVDEFIKGFDYFRQNAMEGLSVSAFLQLTISLLVFFLIRTVVWFDMEGISMKPDNIHKKRRGYILGHIGVEFIVAYFISYLITLLRGAADVKVIWYCVVAPSIGLFLSMIIDHKIIMPLEKNLPGSMQLTKDHKGGSKKTDSKDKDSNEINININTGGQNPDEGQSKLQSGVPPEARFEHIPEEIAQDSTFTERIIKEINTMKDTQREHESALQSLTRMCEGISDMVTDLQRAEVQRYGVNLKKKIYHCLGKGFATPQEWEEVEVEYEIYHDILHGNGQIQKLHDTKFAQLNVREDTMSRSLAGFDDMPEDLLCKYGEFDND